MELKDTASAVVSAALAAELGISYRQLSHWCQCGYISERLRSCGSGRTRTLTVDELERLRYLVTLSSEYQNTFGPLGRRRSWAG